MANPHFRNELQLFAALDRLQIGKDSRHGLAFATGWQHRERGRVMTAPGWYDDEEAGMYCKGWGAAVAADISGGDKEVLPPFARFELAKAALTGYCSHPDRVRGATDDDPDVAAACWRDADAVLATMGGKQERSDAV